MWQTVVLTESYMTMFFCNVNPLPQLNRVGPFKPEPRPQLGMRMSQTLWGRHVQKRLPWQ
jgi:hypothetical protein